MVEYKFEMAVQVMQEQCDIDQMNSSFETVVGEDSRSSDAILIE